MKAKYFPNDSFMKAKLGYGPSYAWRSILEGRKVIEHGSRWKFGDGCSIRLKDKWIRVNQHSSPITCIPDDENVRACDLFDDSGTMWNRAKVESFFWPIDVEAVMQIPIPRIKTMDKLIWNGTKSGVYSVRTGYELACHLANKPSEGSSVSTSEVFKKLWNTKIPRKVLHFVWRLLHRAIPTANNLRRRNITVNQLCSRCVSKMEDEKHCFLKCKFSCAVWNIIVPGNVFSTTSLPFSTWLEQNILSSTHTQRSILFMTLYSIWLSRNQAIFEGNISNPDRIAIGIISRLDELSTADIGRNIPPRSQHRPAWSRPSPGFIKINFDASFLSSNDSSSGGIVARNADGEVLVAGCFGFEYCSDAKHAEAKVAVKAMDIALMMGYKHVIFEGDCKVLIDEVNSRRLGFEAQDITEVEDLINGLFVSSSGVDSWEMTHSRRETNSLAHYLASRRRTLNSDTIYFCPIPDWLATLANCDVTFSGDPP